MIVLGIGLAVAGAGCYAIAATCQHAAVRTVSDGGRLSWSQVRALPGQRRWLLGLLALVCGGTLHTVALSLAPLVVVQPVGVLAIGLTALLATVIGRARRQRVIGVGVLVTTGGIAGFVLLAARDPGAGPPRGGDAVSWIAVIAALTIGVLVLVGRRVHGWARCPLFAAAAGVSYGSVSTLVRIVVVQVRAGGAAAIPVGPVIGLVAGIAVGIVVGAWCVQHAYASGHPATAVAGQTLVDPLVAVLFGALLFGETDRWNAIQAVAELACAAVAGAGVVTLARARSTDGSSVF